MAVAIVILAWALLLGGIVALATCAGRADRRESRLLRLALRALGDHGQPRRVRDWPADRQLEAGREQHYRACDARARRGGYVDLRPSASRGRRAA